ncbi:mechanosensitive ion channel [Virgibacillus sp. W0181]|uniref:mechanosensitive ion channel n=1 Tax=Virgibacillus sp. W0181 TaxID=3391581 RepID=UPI003F461310
MENFMDQYLSENFMEGVQNFVIAIIVLLIGWLIAKLIGSMVEKALKKVDLDDKLLNKFRTSDKPINADKVIGKTVYYILLLVVFILFFNLLNLDMIANPLSDLISTFFNFIPAVLKAALILALAWIIAAAVQWLIVTGTKKLNLHQFLYKIKLAKTQEEVSNFMETLGKVAFYLILLLFIPGVLDALSISGVSEPFSNLVSSFLAFIPVLITAGLIFVIGWFVAKIVKSIVVNLLDAAGSEKLIARLKLNKVFEGSSFASFIGNLVFVFIMIPITIAALEKLNLTGITDPAIAMLNQIMNMIPNILIAAALIIVGIWLGKLIGEYVGQFLARMGFNRLALQMNIGSKLDSERKMTPSTIVGYVVQVLIVFFLAAQALHVIKLDFLVNIAKAITAYLPLVLSAVLILGIAFILANMVQKVLLNLLSGPATSILAGFAKYAIIVLAVFMALTQLGIATTIVSSAFILILGGLALAFGLAFGFGGKDFARKYLQKFDNTIDETSTKQSDIE